jgi:hypothetical protein
MEERALSLRMVLRRAIVLVIGRDLLAPPLSATQDVYMKALV